MIKRALTSVNFWIALILLAANGAAWAYALAPEGPAAQVEARLAPDLADLRRRLGEGGHGGEAYVVEVTDQEVAETIAWYLKSRPRIPFGEPQVTIDPGGIQARGVAQVAGLRVRLAGRAQIALREGVPYVSLADLDVAGVAVPGFVQDRIQAEIDAQFALARDLPIVIDELVLAEGRATVRGTIR
ncbi:MAG: hypothetical protein PVJ34_22600 [Anaerolineae bacterium]|jgi:hypothetical protein